MIEDIMDYGASNSMYKEQPPLRPPPMMPPASITASVSPRFDSIMARSTSVPWSPIPLDVPSREKSTADPLSTNYAHPKSSDLWTNTNPYLTTSDRPMFNNSDAKQPDGYLNNHPNTQPLEGWMINNSNTKRPDGLTNDNSFTRSTEVWRNNNVPSKPVEPWSSNHMFTKMTDMTMVSNNSSRAPMLKSSNKTSGFVTDRCSPRCKLGMLGFAIGFLAVGIPLAVVLVLWLRQ